MQPTTAQELVQCLLERGETQLSIEAGSGVSQATISRILNGKADVRSSTVEKLTAYASQVRRRRRKAD